MEWQDPAEGLTDHVVICNCSAKVRGVVELLHGDGAQAEPPWIVLLVQDRGLWEANPAWHPADADLERVVAITGCPTSADDLRRARIARARAAVILADPRQGPLADARSTLAAAAIERHNPQVHTVMELVVSSSRVQICTTEVNEIICQGEITEKLIAQSCITPGVKEIFHRLLSSAPGSNQLYLAPLPEGFAGARYVDLVRAIITAGAPFVACGFVQRGLELAPDRPLHRRVVVNPHRGEDPGRETALAAGDELIVLALEQPRLQPYLEAGAPV